jgi:hypothetical protein
MAISSFINLKREDVLAELKALIITLYNEPDDKKSNINKQRNTKIGIQPILFYRGSFPSHFIRTVKLRVRISSVTDAAVLRRDYRAILNASSSTPSKQQSFRRS